LCTERSDIILDVAIIEPDAPVTIETTIIESTSGANHFAIESEN
jgi:hypothetical protein